MCFGACALEASSGFRIAITCWAVLWKLVLLLGLGYLFIDLKQHDSYTVFFSILCAMEAPSSG